MKLDENLARWLPVMMADSEKSIRSLGQAYVRERAEFLDMLHERDGFVKLSLEEKLERMKDKIRGIHFNGLTFRNPILISSSPLTQSYETIDHYLDQGAAGVVLKSAGNFQVECRCERKTFSSGCQRRVAIPCFGVEGRVVFSTSIASRHCERITFEEAQELYDKIKRHYPGAVVIASFGPEKEEDFEKLDQLPGDAIEVTTRYFQKSYKKPLVLGWWKKHDSEPEHEEFTPNLQRFVKHHENIFRILKEQLPRITRPTLYKFIGRTELPFNPNYDQREIPSNGFTIGDSRKHSTYTGDGTGLALHKMHKGSWSGDFLFQEHWMEVAFYRECGGEKFISWSGGIFGAHTTLTALFYGADTVQLCSAIYHNGNEIVGRILKKLGCV